MTELRVCLTAMPWQGLDSPSLPLGLLRAACRGAGREVPATYHGNLRWAEFLLDRSGGSLGTADYTDVAENGIFHGIGDWVFSGALHEDDDFGRAALAAYLRDRGVDPGRAAEMREYAADFVELAARELLDLGPDVVGFSTTFMQNVPSLAVAARLKRLAPHVVTVFGGGNCDGPMGAALHRNYPWVDFVVRGEGETVLPALLDAIESGAAPQRLPGVCWRRGGETVANPESGTPLPPGRIPTPDYDDWFERLENSPVEGHVEPKLVLESARGCWWGEAHQCTFCGLNGSLIQFRSKPADRMLAELTGLVARHRTLDVIMVDNIIDNRYFTEVLPRVAALGWDLRIHYEVKSNLTPAQVRALRAARVAHVQPGIESLSSRVLKLMDKGVDGVRNVRTLRECESAGLTTTWNFLYGFPGEHRDDYLPVIRGLPALVHLQPPTDATPILLERFSPNFDRPEIGFTRRRPARFYDHVYDLPESELGELVYLFDSDYLGVEDDVVDALDAAIGEWKKRYHDSTLVRYTTGEGLVLEDRRSGWPARDHVVADPALVAAYEELEHGRSAPAVLTRLTDRGVVLTPTRLAAWLDELEEAGLVFREGDRYVALATTGVPVRIRS
jgi:ribosomal peptide maturation radical SAM protein 1